jgi:hypothetical protein
MVTTGQGAMPGDPLAARKMSVAGRNLERMSEHATEPPVVEPVSGLPEGLAAELADMPPGPELAVALAAVDRTRLSGYDMVVVLRARSRQLAHEQAEFAADLTVVAVCVRAETAHISSVWDSDIPALAASEIAAALTWTKRAAKARLEDARLLVEGVPPAWAALRAGDIDLPKARVLAEGTWTLPASLARRVAEQILPEAPGLTTGQLAYRLRRLVLEVDPDAATKDYENGVAQRKVTRGLNPDGTAYLAGCNLPADQTAAADERLDALARAVKQAGDDRPMDVIRADVFLGVLAGTFTGPSPISRRGVIELTCDLPTLMGLADHPGELAGWGPVIADIARHITADRTTTDTDTVWRYSITNPITGGLAFHGTTRKRPTQPQPQPNRPDRDPRRAPTGTQRAFVVARDRTCRGPGCRVPAARTHLDHITDHADGGPTQVWNLDCKCAACHHLKDAGWKVHRNHLDEVVWTSPLGHTYTIPAEPITTPRHLTPIENLLLQTLRRRT